MYNVKNLGDKMIMDQIKGVSNELEKLENCPKPKDEKEQAKHDKEVERVSSALQELISEAKSRNLIRKERAKEKKAKKGKSKPGMTGGSPNAQPVSLGKSAEPTPNGSEQNPNKENGDALSTGPVG